MRLTGIELAHYRCFDAVELSLEPGVTVIHGANGAGKTTLLESVLFGLYGSSALADATLADVVTRGEEEALVALSFVHEGEDYHLERELSVTGERATTRRCELHEPDGEMYEGAKDVGERITELLRMDGEAFVNSAYVKQGEINKLLHATPAERQSMIDELLQLGRLEAYRDRSDEARLAVRSLVRSRGDVIDELETQREQLAEDDPYDRLNELETSLEEAIALVDELQTRRDELVSERDALIEARETLEERLDQRDTLETQREELETALTELTERRETIRDDIVDTRERRRAIVDTLEERLTKVGLADSEAVTDRQEELEGTIAEIESTIEDHRETVEETRERAASVRERQEAITERLEDDQATHASLEQQLEEDIAALEDRTTEIESLDTQLEERIEDLDVSDPTESALASALAAVTDTLEVEGAQLRAHRDERAVVSEHIDQANELAKDDRCPTCGQPVDESPHLEQLEEDREHLASLESDIDDKETTIEQLEIERDDIETAIGLLERRESRLELLDERERVIDERRDRIEALADSIESAKEELEGLAKAETATEATIESARKAIAESNERLQDRRGQLEALESIETAQSDLDELESALDRLGERREHLDELETERHNQLADIEARLEEVETALAEHPTDELETTLESIAEALEATEAQLQSAQTKRDELTETIGSVRTDIERLEEIDARLSDAKERQAELIGLRDEAVELGQLYESVRTELRERNVRTLERLLNETFELLYRNEAYERIDLDVDYELAVQSKDGTALDPAQLSGGERAIFNLSLRCAIYRLLAEGVEGAAPMPPLMLDEPTVFLDQGHVGRLIRLLETMRSFGVEQTLVVSHHEALLDAAEHRIAVEKDPTLNRSAVSSIAAIHPMR